jgi:type VI secretion system secreted protein VgrG
MDPNAELTSKLTDEPHRIKRFSGSEGLSELYFFDVDLDEVEELVDVAKVMGTVATLAIGQDEGRGRLVSGIVQSVQQLDRRDDGAIRYRVRLVPLLSLLTLRTDCRIFHEKNVRTIIEKVFESADLTDFKFVLARDHPDREYCVQYCETDYAFISRLMEEEGLYFFFEHEEDKQVVVITDSSDLHSPCPNLPPIRYWQAAGSEKSSRDTLSDWNHHRSIHSSGFSLKSYSFESPSDILQVRAATVSDNPLADYHEVFDYPGKYKASNVGEQLAQVRMESLETASAQVTACSGSTEICSGFTFNLSHHFQDSANGDYLITRVEHEMDEEAAPRKNEPDIYRNRLTCVPVGVAYRSAFKTPKPRIYGTQTAFVVGPDDEEIYTNSEGRIKLRFHWDRWGRTKHESGDAWDTSCFVRVAQSVAGKAWGGMFLPRIGHEVVVEFIDGDPEAPLVTGAVYNGLAQPPYKLPDKQTVSTIKTNSSKGGGGFNELRFVDAKDEEQVFLRGQKDYDLWIGNDRRENVVQDQHLFIGRHRVTKVTEESHETIESHRYEIVKKDDFLNVGGKQAIEVKDNSSVKVGGDVVEEFGGDHSEKTTGDLFLDAKGIVIEAATGITLKVGGSSIVLDAAGVTIKGAVVTVDGSMVKIASGPGSSPTAGSAGTLDAPEEPKLPDEADDGKEK